MDVRATEEHIRAVRALGVEGRLRLAESLREFAWALKTSVIATQHPELSATQVAARVREAFGGVSD